ncbi:hypothetical protein CR513_24672, partial [Mucuna pruriens]
MYAAIFRQYMARCTRGKELPFLSGALRSGLSISPWPPTRTCLLLLWREGVPPKTVIFLPTGKPVCESRREGDSPKSGAGPLNPLLDLGGSLTLGRGSYDTAILCVPGGIHVNQGCDSCTGLGEYLEHLGHLFPQLANLTSELRASRPSRTREHLGLVEAENIPAQADVTEQEICGNEGISDYVGLDLDLTSLCINKARQATPSLTHFGGRKTQCLAITGAPLPSFHWRSSWKADSLENAEFPPFLFSALKHKTPLFTAFQSLRPSQPNSAASIRNRVSPTLLRPSLCLAETVSDSSLPRASNTHYFYNGGSTTSRGKNGIAVADSHRFVGYIDGCGMCGSVGHPPNDCPILQEPPPPFRPQPVQESSLEDLMKQLAMNNIQFQKNVFATQQPMQQPNSSPSLIQQNNMQFQQNIIATMQELTTQIGQLATTINQLQFEDFGQVPSQAILNPQENISDITVRCGMKLPQQQSLKVQYGFSRNPNLENSTTVSGFADSNSVAKSMLVVADSTKMVEINDCVPTVSNLADVVKIANSMIDVTDLTDMTLDEILDQVTRVEIADPACADVDITNPMCVDAKMADPRYVNADNAFADRVEDVDSLVDKSNNVNMTRVDIIKVADSGVNISTFADMSEMSDFVGNVSNFANVVDNSNNANITKVLDSGTEVSDSINNFLAHEPTLADLGNQSRIRNQAKFVFDPKCQIRKKAETDSTPQG